MGVFGVGRCLEAHVHERKHAHTLALRGSLDPRSMHRKIYSIHGANDAESAAYVGTAHAAVKALCVCVGGLLCVHGCYILTTANSLP